jgi:hypothetical protein
MNVKNATTAIQPQDPEFQSNHTHKYYKPPTINMRGSYRTYQTSHSPSPPETTAHQKKRRKKKNKNRRRRRRTATASIKSEKETPLSIPSNSHESESLPRLLIFLLPSLQNQHTHTKKPQLAKKASIRIRPRRASPQDPQREVERKKEKGSFIHAHI